jgi:hypothetical protein
VWIAIAGIRPHTLKEIAAIKGSNIEHSRQWPGDRGVAIFIAVDLG